MTKLALACAALTAATMTVARSEVFPLTFKTIPATNAMAFAGDWGVYGALRMVKPPRLTAEPAAASTHPLYGECRQASDGAAFAFRLDESQGDGKGYDRLIMDVNGNNDLTDDPVVERIVRPTDPKRGMQQLLFGPITAPANRAVAGGRPVYYAEVYVNPQVRQESAEALANIYAGQVRLKPGWYLEAAVELGNVREKVGVYDANCNFRLGDVPRPIMQSSSFSWFSRSSPSTWYFQPADLLLLEPKGRDSLPDPSQTKLSTPFASVVYLGNAPYRVALGADSKTLSVTAWTEPVAEVALQPHGGQVQSVAVARALPNNKWELLHPAIADGKLKLPPGDYRFYDCTLKAEAGSRQVTATGRQPKIKTPVTYAAGQSNILVCGAPLEVKVTATKRTPGLFESSGRRASSEADSEYLVAINAEVVGAAGEGYSSYTMGKDSRGSPPRPAFTVTDANGKKVGSGKLEYG